MCLGAQRAYFRVLLREGAGRVQGGTGLRWGSGQQGGEREEGEAEGPAS